jgi:hypothetical protein
VGNGVDTRFWEDISPREMSLAYQYAILYNIVQRKEVSFPYVLSQNPLNMGRLWEPNGWLGCIFVNDYSGCN